MTADDPLVHEVTEEILLSGDDDWVMLLEVERFAASRVGVANHDARVKDVGLAAIAGLLRAGLMRAGELTIEGPFRAWPGSWSESLERIEREWRDLDRGLEMGEVCWFELTSEGYAAVATLDNVGGAAADDARTPPAHSAPPGAGGRPPAPDGESDGSIGDGDAGSGADGHVERD